MVFELAAEPIKLHPQNERYFMYQGSPKILVTSGEIYGSVLNLDFDYITYLDELQSKGLNLTRTFTFFRVPHGWWVPNGPLDPLSHSSYCAP